MSRGLTLLEMLLSLAIFSSMMIVAVGWMQSAGTASVKARKQLIWRSAANAALQVIHDDLATGDFELMQHGNTQPKPLVIIENEALSVTTRSIGEPAVHVYSLEISTRQISRSAGGEARLLVSDVDEFILDHDEDEAVLTVEIRSGKQMLTRRFNLR